MWVSYRITNANKQHARRSAGAGESKEINMSDLIDRQQAIEAICMETCGASLRNERCIVHCTEVQTVEMLPPAQPEPHWHPVSEHPQEDDDYLLLTHEKTKYGTFKRIIIGAWNGATKEWLEEYEGMYRDVNHPVAWISKEELLLLKGWEVTE